MFKYIDLFCGIGGLRLPFHELGGECVFSSEVDKYAIDTYTENYGDAEFHDINHVQPSDIPSHDLLLAGFPCQPFSQAGKKLGFSDPRGGFFHKIVQILSYHRPKAFLLENVKGLLRHDNGGTFALMLSLIPYQYKVYYKVISATDFDLPQKRERVFVVGLLSDTPFQFPEPVGLHHTVGDILEKCVSDVYTISDKAWEGHLERKARNLSNGKGFGYSLFTPDSPYTNTISARYGKDGSEALIAQDGGKNPRKLTPRECARLQGFPDSFKIPVSDTQAYKQFGNSVPVAVVRAIAQQMYPYLIETTPIC